MKPENQHVRTHGAARPRNLAVGCLAVLVVLLACGLLARFVRDEDADTITPPDPPAAVESVSRSVSEPVDP
ncbi:hypothetical protein [Rubrivirga litoralis]|uniref:Uncharacterized protein n=1 Tax=Rubrivirga litoralis TaxID=3075598 RepID=A0ABU3BNG0_9BACT|nr:hypothetical protein [Rubrivirga sp. F394]MDT0630840.1 hypothetical protein [Rubrivirga sp. F394]